MTREELIEVMAKGMWNKHCQMYPKDSLLRGEWKADEDIGFLYTRFSLYAEAAWLAALEAACVAVTPRELTEAFQELAKRQEPLGADFEAAIGDRSTLYEIEDNNKQ